MFECVWLLIWRLAFLLSLVDSTFMSPYTPWYIYQHLSIKYVGKYLIHGVFWRVKRMFHATYPLLNQRGNGKSPFLIGIPGKPAINDGFHPVFDRKSLENQLFLWWIFCQVSSLTERWWGPRIGGEYLRGHRLPSPRGLRWRLLCRSRRSMGTVSGFFLGRNGGFLKPKNGFPKINRGY